MDYVKLMWLIVGIGYIMIGVFFGTLFESKSDDGSLFVIVMLSWPIILSICVAFGVIVWIPYKLATWVRSKVAWIDEWFR